MTKLRLTCLIAPLCLGLAAFTAARAENTQTEQDFRAETHQDDHNMRPRVSSHREQSHRQDDRARNYEHDAKSHLDAEDFMRRFGYAPR